MKSSLENEASPASFVASSPQFFKAAAILLGICPSEPYCPTIIPLWGPIATPLIIGELTGNPAQLKTLNSWFPKFSASKASSFRRICTFGFLERRLRLLAKPRWFANVSARGVFSATILIVALFSNSSLTATPAPTTTSHTNPKTTSLPPHCLIDSDRRKSVKFLYQCFSQNTSIATPTSTAKAPTLTNTTIQNSFDDSKSQWGVWMDAKIILAGSLDLPRS